MTTYLEAYEEMVRTVEHWSRRKAARIERIKDITASELGGGKPKLEGATVDFVSQGRIAKDQLVAEYQLMHDRAVQEAIMFGIGALLDPTKIVRLKEMIIKQRTAA